MAVGVAVRRSLGPGWALATVCLAEAMALLDVIVVTVALPSIDRELGFSLSGLQWVITGYALPLGGLLLLAGRVGDRWGHRRVFAGGLVLFTAGSLAGGLAPVPAVLVGARVVQGVGAAALATSALSLVTVIFAPGPSRHRALGALSAVAALGFTLGSVAGGAVTQLLGWRWVLLINVPVAVAALALTALALPPDRPVQEAGPLDVPGAVGVTVGLTGLLYGVSEAPRLGGGAPQAWAPALGGVLVLAGLVLWERRAPAPLIPRGFFADRAARVANTAMLLKSSVGIAGAVVPTIYLQQLRGLSPLLTGAVFVPGGVLGLAVGVWAAALTRALGGPARAALAGLAVLVLGLALMLGMPATGVPWLQLAGNALLGPGLVITDIALASIATTAAGHGQHGLTAAVFRTCGQLGAVAGLALVTAVAAAVTARHPQPGSAEALRAGLQAGLLGAVVIVVLAAAVMLAPRRP